MTLKIFYRVWPTQIAGHSHTVTNINHTKNFPSEREPLYGYENSYEANFFAKYLCDETPSLSLEC